MYISVKDKKKNIYISDVEIIYAGDINHKPVYKQDYDKDYEHDQESCCRAPQCQDEKYDESLLEKIISFIDNLCVAKES